MSMRTVYSGSYDELSELQRACSSALVAIVDKDKQIAERDELIRDMWHVIQYPHICVDPYVLRKRAKALGIEVER